MGQPQRTGSSRTAMSYPYHYVDYSTPTTPRVLAWGAEHAHGPVLQQQALAMTQEQQQEHTQAQENATHHQQQLPPIVQQPQPQAQMRIQQPQMPSYHPPPTIQLQERALQSQYRFETLTEEDFAQQAAAEAAAAAAAAASASAADSPASRSDGSGRRASRPPLHLHVSSTRPSVSPTALSSVAGPSRTQRTHTAQQGTHPYRRPASAASTASRVTVKARKASSEQHEGHMQLQTRPGASNGPIIEPMPGGPATAAALVSCPALNSWKEKLMRASGGQDSTSATPTPADLQARAARPQRYVIRTDTHYDEQHNVLTFMLELPGVKKSDLHIGLASCPYSRVRQLTVAGTTRSPLPMQGHGTRERKFGEFVRTLPVPPETKSHDVQVSMEDGILTLSVPGGESAEPEPIETVNVL